MRRIRRPYINTPPVRAPVSRTFMATNEELTEENQHVQSEISENDELTYDAMDRPQPASSCYQFNCINDDNPPANSFSNCSVFNAFALLKQEDELTGETKLERILKSVREVIACCACYSTETIMKECINGHLICQNCFLTLRQDERPQCPTCRVSLYSDSRRALIAQKVLSELPDCCPECGTKMLHKSLASHRMNTCPNRRVACGLSAIGCDWVGEAEHYDRHYHECLLRKQLSEKPIAENLDFLLTRFKKREQSIRETFHCFVSVLRHLESYELSTVTVLLSCAAKTDSGMTFRSDHFHANQSRWTGEIFVNFPTETQSPAVAAQQVQSSVAQANQEVENPPSELPATGTLEAQSDSQVRSTVQGTQVASESYISSWLDTTSRPIRSRRRWTHVNSQRCHPYRDQRRLLPGDSPNLPVAESSQTTISLPEKTTDIGEIKYTMLKENSPGIGRRAYAFILLQIRVPETRVQIYARPQIQNYRFATRGDQTAAYPVYPIRWRYISSLKEMSKYGLIQADFVIARKIADEHVES